jgi:hypothetical protein
LFVKRRKCVAILFRLLPEESERSARLEILPWSDPLRILFLFVRQNCHSSNRAPIRFAVFASARGVRIRSGELLICQTRHNVNIEAGQPQILPFLHWYGRVSALHMLGYHSFTGLRSKRLETDCCSLRFNHFSLSLALHRLCKACHQSCVLTQA